MKAVIITALVYQAGCVLAGAKHLPWPGTVVALLIVSRHVATALAGWCVLMPLRVRLSQHLDDFSPVPPGPVLATWSARV